MSLPRPHARSSSATERYLGVAGAVSLAVGAVAICGSPAAVWSYAADLCGALWSLLAS
jgi:hypothetical protein